MLISGIHDASSDNCSLRCCILDRNGDGDDDNVDVDVDDDDDDRGSILKGNLKLVLSFGPVPVPPPILKDDTTIGTRTNLTMDLPTIVNLGCKDDVLAVIEVVI